MSQVENNKQKQYITNSKKANRIIRFRTLMASGLGFIPIPLLDAAAILSVQLWMLRDISKVYGIPFKKNVARSIIGTLVSNIGTVSILKLIPGINLLGGGAVAMSAGASTYALGKVFTQHFDQGGTLLSFNPVKSRAYFEQVYEESKITVEELKEQEDSFKEADIQALASVATLKKANSELMTTITNLEKQLQESKKERAVALAVAESQTKPKQVVPKAKGKKRKIGKIGRIMLLVVFAALITLALFRFNIIGGGKPNNDNISTGSLGGNPQVIPNNDIVKNDNNSVPETNVIDTTETTNNLPDSINTISDTTNQPIQNNLDSNSVPLGDATGSIPPQDSSSNETLAN
jgi:uncharacterized protein (DUF697 family)